MMNDKTKPFKKAKNDKASRCCWSAYQKKDLGEMGLSEMKLGEMLPNHCDWNQKQKRGSLSEQVS